MSDCMILIADDEPFILRSLAYVLRKAGYQVETASNGEEALIKAEIHHPRIIFLDIMMPHKNGYEVCCALKSKPSFEETYIIMLTARGQELDRQNGMRAGADEYITKPFSPRQMVHRVEELLQQPVAERA